MSSNDEQYSPMSFYIEIFANKDFFRCNLNFMTDLCNANSVANFRSAHCVMRFIKYLRFEPANNLKQWIAVIRKRVFAGKESQKCSSVTPW